MNQRTEITTTAIGKWLLKLAFLAFIAYLLWRTYSLVVLVLVAAVMAAALEPIVSWLCRFRIKQIHPKTQRMTATILVFVAAIILFVLSVSWMVAPFGTEFRKLGGYVEFGKRALDDFSTDVQQVYKDLPPMLQDVIPNNVGPEIAKRATVLTAALSKTATSWISHLWEILLVPVLAFYFVVDPFVLKKYFVSLITPRYRREALYILHDGGLVFRSYIIGQLILCAIAGVVMYGVLTWFDIRYSLTLSVFAAVTRAVPIVGPIISGVLIALVVAASSPVMAFKVMLVFIALHFIESKIIMPMLLGERMRLHPAVLLISILVAYEFFGLIGMFLAAPVAAMVRTLLRRYYIARSNVTPANSGRLDLQQKPSDSKMHEISVA